MRVSDNIKTAAKFIKEGKLVAFPTETVYGLGANALNPLAVAKIFEAKERPSFDPLIIHIADFEDLKKFTKNPHEGIFKIAEKFWPGPLTMVLPKSDIIPDIVTSGLPTVGIRMPKNKIALELIRSAGCPIAAPSANKFGRISPTQAAHVKKQLKVDYILEGGKTTVGIESTIIKITNKGFQILRNGIITREELERVMPFDKTPVINELSAPGMMKSHYSPHKKLLIATEENQKQIDKSKAGLISFTGKLEANYKKVIKVSENQDLKDYAVNVFEAMHSLEDDNEIDVIIAEPVDEKGIGIAIMDRLKKAEYNWKKSHSSKS